jgi:tripeptide aminopeptidase
MEEKVAEFNQKHGEGTAEVEIKEQYRNMKQQFEGKMHIVDLAAKAMTEAGIEPKIKAIRGGTDGAQFLIWDFLVRISSQEESTSTDRMNM